MTDGITWAMVGVELGADGKEVSRRAHGQQASKNEALRAICSANRRSAKQFDRQTFSERYTETFGALWTGQRTGLDALLSFLEPDAEIADVRWAAYMLTTI